MTKAKPEGVKTETWSVAKLATLVDPKLWDVDACRPVREVGCRKCGGRIPKGTDAAQARPKAGVKSFEGWFHYDCAQQVCAASLAASEQRMAEYRADYERRHGGKGD